MTLCKTSIGKKRFVPSMGWGIQSDNHRGALSLSLFFIGGRPSVEVLVVRRLHNPSHFFGWLLFFSCWRLLSISIILSSWSGQTPFFNGTFSLYPFVCVAGWTPTVGGAPYWVQPLFFPRFKNTDHAGEREKITRRRTAPWKRKTSRNDNFTETTKHIKNNCRILFF